MAPYNNWFVNWFQWEEYKINIPPPDIQICSSLYLLYSEFEYEVGYKTIKKYLSLCTWKVNGWQEIKL